MSTPHDEKLDDQIASRLEAISDFTIATFGVKKGGEAGILHMEFDALRKFVHSGLASVPDDSTQYFQSLRVQVFDALASLELKLRDVAPKEFHAGNLQKNAIHNSIQATRDIRERLEHAVLPIIAVHKCERLEAEISAAVYQKSTADLEKKIAIQRSEVAKLNVKAERLKFDLNKTDRKIKSNTFASTAHNHFVSSRRWLAFLIGSGLAALIATSCLAFEVHSISHEVRHAKEAAVATLVMEGNPSHVTIISPEELDKILSMNSVLFVLSRILLGSLFVVILKITLTKYNQEKHLHILYGHRSTVFSTFDQIRAEDTDPDTARQMELQLCKMLLAEPETGYSSPSKGDLNISPSIGAMGSGFGSHE